MLQGERQFARDNKTIGKFKLDDIPSAPRGVPQIEVTFDIDANGYPACRRQGLGHRKEQKITNTASSVLKDEIEKMRKDAETHADEDKRPRRKRSKRATRGGQRGVPFREIAQGQLGQRFGRQQEQD